MIVVTMSLAALLSEVNESVQIRRARNSQSP
jgi:hypothetical protein